MRIAGRLRVYDVCNTPGHEDQGKESLLGMVVKHSGGWRFDPADDWTLSPEQLVKIVVLLEALK